MGNLKDLVQELMSLNDENLAKRVIQNKDIQQCLSELYDILFNENTLIKHGQWLPPVVSKYGCLCSECGLQADNDYEYCPNCGTKMN